MTNQTNQDKVTTHEVPHTFEALGVSEKLLSVLNHVNFKTPTPIQQKAIPIAIEGKDLVGIAQTGTGKSLAFGLPMLQLLVETTSQGKGLIILPTRELAAQINETLQNFGKQFGVRTAVLIGGAPMFPQINQIKNKPHIIIGTPGRIIDHIQQKNLNLHNVSILVLDEADCMFDMGFAPQIKQILQSVPKNRQTMLFSATMPDSIIKLATLHMKLPVRVEIARQGSANEKVDHELFFIKRDYKGRLLENLLKEYKGTVLVFCRTKFTVKKITHQLFKKGFTASEIHSNRTLAQRRQALEGFKNGKYRILVATDIASRGIDVKGIELVINYDLPESPGDYVHRIGRTGRAGLTGKAISLVTPDQKFKVKEIERLIRSTIPILQLPELPEIPVAHTPLENVETQYSQEKEVTSRDRDSRGNSESKNRSRSFRSRPFGERNSENKNRSRSFGSRPFGERDSENKNRSGNFRSRPFGERRDDGERDSENKNRSRSFGSRPFGKRRDDGERDSENKGRSRSFGSRPFGKRDSENKSRSRSFGARPFGRRRDDGERNSENKNRSGNFRSRPFGERDSENKNRSSNFRSRPFGERDSENKGRSRSFGARPFGKRREDGENKPSHFRSNPFGEKQEGSETKPTHSPDKPFKKHYTKTLFKKRKFTR